MSRGEQVRARVVFTGSVQGVGFRFTTRHTASGFAVTGFVRNESDGSVTLVAEGRRAEVEAFIEAVKERMAGYVGNAEVSWGAATGEFEAFGVGFAW